MLYKKLSIKFSKILRPLQFSNFINRFTNYHFKSNQLSSFLCNNCTHQHFKHATDFIIQKSHWTRSVKKTTTTMSSTLADIKIITNQFLTVKNQLWIQAHVCMCVSWRNEEEKMDIISITVNFIVRTLVRENIWRKRNVHKEKMKVHTFCIYILTWTSVWTGN